MGLLIELIAGVSYCTRAANWQPGHLPENLRRKKVTKKRGKSGKRCEFCWSTENLGILKHDSFFIFFLGRDLQIMKTVSVNVLERSVIVGEGGG